MGRQPIYDSGEVIQFNQSCKIYYGGGALSAPTTMRSVIMMIPKNARKLLNKSPHTAVRFERNRALTSNKSIAGKKVPQK